MVGEKDLVRRRMALNETKERDSLWWKIQMSSLTATLASETSSEKSSQGSRDRREKGRRGKSRHFYQSNFYSPVVEIVGSSSFSFIQRMFSFVPEISLSAGTISDMSGVRSPSPSSSHGPCALIRRKRYRD